MEILVVEAALPMLKVHLLDHRGQVVRSVRRQIPTDSSYPGAHEIPSSLLESSLFDSIQDCVAHSGATPALITVTGQDDGLIFTDDLGRPVHAAISGDDSRAIGLIDQWLDSGILAAGFRRSGNAASTGSTVTLLRHLVDTDPESVSVAHRAGNLVAGITSMLSPSIGISPDAIPLQIVDPHRGAYDEELIDLFRLRQVRHLLPQIGSELAPFKPGGSLAELAPYFASDTLVHPGSIEPAAVWHATGGYANGDAVIHLGRDLNVMVPVNRIDFDTPPGGLTIRAGVPQLWLRAIPSSSGMAALDWYLAMVGSSYQELNGLVEMTPAGANGVAVVPIVAASRERGTFIDPRVSGRFRGINESTTPADMARAVCEGIAYSARHALSFVGYERDRAVRFCGGGVRAPAFRQLLADVLNRPVSVEQHPEPAALGAAELAAASIETAIDYPRQHLDQDVVLPDNSLSDLYEHGFHQFFEELQLARSMTTKSASYQ